jgi:carboxyl-terminal processing protease
MAAMDAFPLQAAAGIWWLAIGATLVGACAHAVPTKDGARPTTGPPSLREVRRIADIVAKHHLIPVEVDDLMNVATAAMAARDCSAAPCAAGESGDEADRGRAGLEAMMRSLHDDSKYIWPRDFIRLSDQDDQTSASVGVKLRAGARYPEVSWTLPDSPAAAAGVERGAEVRSIDGVRLTAAALEDAGARLRGRLGSSVTLTLARPDQPERTVILRRGPSNLDAIDCRVLGGSILYLHVYQLGSQTMTGIHELDARVGAPARTHGVILDLRGNQGGLLTTTEQLADVFMQSGPLFVQRQRRSELHPQAKPGTSALGRIPLAVLIDEETGSGAETIAAALQDGRRAILFGSRTAAKAHIDAVIESHLGGAVRLVVGDLRRGNGAAIDGVGVLPDVPVDPGTNPGAAVSGASDVVCAGVISPALVVTDPVVARAIAHLLANRSSSTTALPAGP